MEEFQRLAKEAEQSLVVADHMLTVTYPLVKDTKLLLNILMNIQQGMVKAMGAILSNERLFKRIPPYGPSFYDQMEVFQARATRRYSLNPEYLKTMKDIHEVLELHKSSPVEFQRQDKLVICSDKYRLSTISVAQLRGNLDLAKLFIADMQRMVSKHERIFR
ncbi:MAG: hypothetical protein V1735_02005 [Nanoarchaeota archaeon]